MKTEQLALFGPEGVPGNGMGSLTRTLHHAIVLEWGLCRRELGLDEKPDAAGLKLLQARLAETPLLEEEQAIQSVRAFFSDKWALEHSGSQLSVMCYPARWDKHFVTGPKLRAKNRGMSKQATFESDAAFWG